MAVPFGNVGPIDSIGSPLPLVERTADGGIVLANEYVRASAANASALQIDGEPHAALHALIGDGRYVGETADSLRWIRSPRPGESLVVREQWNIGGGPTLDLYRECDGVWSRPSPSNGKTWLGYFSVVRRGGPKGDLLALEARSLGDDMIRHLAPHTIVRLDGAGAVPRLPKDACIETMSAADDGTVIGVGTSCAKKKKPADSDEEEAEETLTLDVVIFPPNATTGKLAHIKTGLDKHSYPHLVTYAASRNELYVGVANVLHAFDGQKWYPSTIPGPRGGGAIRSISRGPSGVLFVATTEGLFTRNGRSIPLPTPPSDPLDTKPIAPDVLTEHFGSEPPLPNRGKPLPLVPLWIDAQREDEILILARSGDTSEKEPVYPPGVKPGMKWVPAHQPGEGYELVLLSTKKREPLLRLPSQLGQLASMKVPPATSKKKTTTTKACAIDFRVGR